MRSLKGAKRPRLTRRRGATVVTALVSSGVMIGITALAIDLGLIYVGKSQLQVSADSAALAGAWELIDERRLAGGDALLEVMDRARDRTAQLGYLNPVIGVSPEISLNSGNSLDGDIIMGYMPDPTNPSTGMFYGDPTTFNSVQVTVHRNATRNGGISLFFAKAFGQSVSNIQATATAAFQDGVVGYEIPAGSNQTADLMPFALRLEAWESYLNGTLGNGDSYSYNPDSKQVSSGSDGVPELNLYPGSGAGQLPPGNFGTVDIGSPNNSTADLSRQILHGVNADDLAWFGGKLELDSDGTLNLNGDTGLSAGIKDELDAIKGMPRTIPLFTTVQGPGNNATFKVVGFAGVRIVHVQLTGAMKSKKLLIQPAVSVDGTTVIRPGWVNSYYVYRPPTLVR